MCQKKTLRLQSFLNLHIKPIKKIYMENNDKENELNQSAEQEQVSMEHEEAALHTDAETVEEVEAEESKETTSDDELSRLRKELTEAKEKYMRLYADFENFRRRTAKEKLEFFSTANEGLIASIIPVLDDFERAQKNLHSQQQKDLDAIQQGVDLIHQKLYRVLESKGLKPMNATGEVFNPELHEAITQAPVQDESMKGKVIDEVEKGYYLGEKVVRFAKVVIGA
jgi:molecular chaperone GrpE